jgi:hypothetical protein
MLIGGVEPPERPAKSAHHNVTSPTVVGGYKSDQEIAASFSGGVGFNAVFRTSFIARATRSRLWLASFRMISRYGIGSFTRVLSGVDFCDLI